MKIIGIFGKKEAGKTTLGKMIKEEMEFLSDDISVIRIAFGDELKKMLIEAGICTYEKLYETKTEFSRFMLQKIGTEIVRKVRPDYWCEIVLKKIENEYFTEKLFDNIEKIIIIDDIRFPNEYKMLASMNSCLIKVSNFVADSKQDDHESENYYEGFNEHFSVDNDKDIEELKKYAKHLAIFTLQTSIRFPGFNDHNRYSWRTKE